MLMYQVCSASRLQSFFLSFFPNNFFSLLPVMSFHALSVLSVLSFLSFCNRSQACVLVNRLFLWFAVVLVPVASFGWDAFPWGS